MYAPRAVSGKLTEADPEPFVVPDKLLMVPDGDGPVRVNVTISPATTPGGGLVRVSVVLTASEFPTSSVLFTVRFAREVEALFRVMTTSFVEDEHGALLIVQRKV